MKWPPAQSYSISRYSPFINAWSVCILFSNKMTDCTVRTLDTTSRDNLPLKTPHDLCAFCAGMKWPPAQCTSMKGTISVRDVTTTSTKLRYPANLLISIMKLRKVESKSNFCHFRIMDLQQVSRAWKKGKNIEKLLYQKLNRNRNF